MKTYFEPSNLDPKNLTVIGRFDGYRDVANPNLPIFDYDVAVGFGGGILLGGRTNEPAKGKYWICGGRKFKNEDARTAVTRIAEGETGLYLEDPIIFLHHCNEFFENDAFDRSVKKDLPKGVDTPSTIYFAYGIGVLKLDYQNVNPKIVVLPSDNINELSKNLDSRSKNIADYQPYTKEFRNSLPDSVRRSVDLALPLVKARKKRLERLVSERKLTTIDQEIGISQVYRSNRTLLKDMPIYVLEDILK